MASGRMFLIGKSKADSSAILRSGRGRLGQRHSSIIKGKRRSCLSQYGHRDRTRGRLRQRHCFEHGFPLIRSLRASAQRLTSLLFSFVLSLIVAASFTIRQSKTSYGFQTRYTQNTYMSQVGTNVQ